jgi:hypothetical protein
MEIDLQVDKAVVNMIWLTLGAELLTSPLKVTEYGTERDELVRQDGRWLFKNRIIRSGRHAGDDTGNLSRRRKIEKQAEACQPEGC